MGGGGLLACFVAAAGLLPQVYSLLSAPPADAPRLVELALVQGSAGKRLRAGLLNFYKKVGVAQQQQRREKNIQAGIYATCGELYRLSWVK